MSPAGSCEEPRGPALTHGCVQLGGLAQEIFGPDRVEIHPDLPDAIEAAVHLAEADPDGELSGVGILITGSVVTVADARRLLKR